MASCQPHPGGAHGLVAIPQGDPGRVRIQGPHGLQLVQRMQATRDRAPRPHQLPQSLRGRAVRPLMQQAGGRVPMPAVWVVHQLHESRRVGPLEVGDATHRRRGIPFNGLQPPDPATLAARVEVQMPLDPVRQRPRVFNGLAVHVDHPQAAVGCVDELDGPKPVVRRGQELRRLLVRRPFTHPFKAVGPGSDPLPMDEVGAAIGDERAARHVRRVGVAAVHRHARGTGEVARGPPAALDHPLDEPGHAPSRAQHPPRLVRRATKHRGGRAVGRDARAARGQGMPGLRHDAVVVEEHLLQVIGIRAQVLPA